MTLSNSKSMINYYDDDEELTLFLKKKEFLNKLRSPSGKLKYKRYLGTPIRYAGGKTLAVGLIIELIPENVKRIVSPFIGGGSVELACAKELNLPVVGYEIFEILVTYWNMQLKYPEELYQKLNQFEPSREEFYRVKEILKKHWKGEKTLKELDLAAHYYFNHNTSYGPHFLGSPSSVYLNQERYKSMINRVRNLKISNMEVHVGSFENTIKNHPNDFLYCDPPYYLEGDSKTFIGLYPHRNFPIHHKNFDHEKLRDMLKKHKGGFILSYNDCSTIREWYKEFNMICPEWQYTFSQGDTRIGKNRKEKNGGSHVKKSHELIIWKDPEW